MIAISKPYQDGLNRTVPLSTFTLMCSCLKMRRSFPFCAWVHTKICQKGSLCKEGFWKHSVFKNTGRLSASNQKRKFSKTLILLSACCIILILCWLTVFNAIKVHFRVISHLRMRRQRQVRKQTHSNSRMAQKRKQDHSGNWLIELTWVESWNKLKKRKKSNVGLCQPRSQVLLLRRDG